jgi:hypothetical protein
VAAILLATASYSVWAPLDALLGEGLVGQVIAVGFALTAGAVVYWGSVTFLRIPEAAQIARLLRRRAA